MYFYSIAKQNPFKTKSKIEVTPPPPPQIISTLPLPIIDICPQIDSSQTLSISGFSLSIHSLYRYDFNDSNFSLCRNFCSSIYVYCAEK